MSFETSRARPVATREPVRGRGAAARPGPSRPRIRPLRPAHADARALAAASQLDYDGRAMDTHRLRNLTFLMSLGGLSAACFSDNGPHEGGTGPGGTTGGTGGGTTGGGTTDPGTTDPGTTTTTGTTDEPSTTEPAAPTTTGELETTTTTGTTDVATTEATTSPWPDGTACAQYGLQYLQCYPRDAPFVDAAIEQCEALIEMGEEIDGPACGKAFEEFYACIASLECRQLAQEYNQPTLCAAPLAELKDRCPVTGEDF